MFKGTVLSKGHVRKESLLCVEIVFGPLCDVS